MESFRAAPVKEWPRHGGAATSGQVQQRLALEEGLDASGGNRAIQAKHEKHPREMRRCLKNLLMFARWSLSKTGIGRIRRCRARGKRYASRSTTVCKKLKTCAAMHNARPHVSPRSRAWQRAEPKALSKGGYPRIHKRPLVPMQRARGFIFSRALGETMGHPSPHQTPLTQLTYPCFLHTILSTTPV